MGYLRNRRVIALAASGILALAGACDRSADRQRQKAEEAEREAERKTIEGARESTSHLTSGELEAREKIDEANANLAQVRQTYRDRTQADLADMNRRINQLEATASTLRGRSKVELDTALSEIRLDRDLFVAASDAAGNAPPEAWNERRQRADLAWQDLVNAMTRTTTRLPFDGYADPMTPPRPPKTPMP